MIFTGTTSELRDAIVAGTDVTSPVSFPGKITLNQLNAFSGALEPEALTNFKTLKIMGDGSVEETNVAKLLIDLQSGSGVEDAKEEALIAISVIEGDNQIKYELKDLQNQFHVYKSSPYEANLPSSPDFSYSFARNVRGVIVSAEIADGEATVFKPAAFYISAKRPLVFLNGVLQNGDEVELSSTLAIAWSASFTTAPEEGSLVEFYFDDAVEGDTEISSIDSVLEDFESFYTNYTSESVAMVSELQADISDITANRAIIQAEIAAIGEEIGQIETEIVAKNDELYAATSVSEVSTIKDELVGKYSLMLARMMAQKGKNRDDDEMTKGIQGRIAAVQQLNAIGNAVGEEYNKAVAALESRKSDIQSAKSTLGYNPPA